MLSKDLLYFIALKLDLTTLKEFLLVYRLDDDFWRLKLKQIGMKDVSKENILDPKEAYKQVINGKDMYEAFVDGDNYRIKYLIDIESLPLSHPLSLAISNSNFEIVKYLIKRGYTDKEYALETASFSGHLEFVKYLVELGADIHTNKNEPLYSSIVGQHYEVVKYLLDNGANMEEANALKNAIKYASNKIVKLLIERGSKVTYEEIRIAKLKGYDREFIHYLKNFLN